MLSKSFFNLDRSDVLSAGDDDVLGAVSEFDISVRITHAKIARTKPSVQLTGACGRFVAVIAGGHVVPADHDFAQRFAVGRHVIAAGIDHADILRDYIADALSRI